MLRDYQRPEPMEDSDKEPSEEIDKVEPKSWIHHLARPLFWRKHCKVRVCTPIQSRKLRNSRYCRQSQPDHGGAISTARGPRQPQKKLRVSIQRNEFHYSRAVLAVTLWTIVEGNDTAIEALLVNDGVHERLKPTVQVALVDLRHRFATLSQLASGKRRYNWQCEGLQMCLVIQRDRRPMTTREIIICMSSCNTLYSLVLSDSKFGVV